MLRVRGLRRQAKGTPYVDSDELHRHRNGLHVSEAYDIRVRVAVLQAESRRDFPVTV